MDGCATLMHWDAVADMRSREATYQGGMKTQPVLQQQQQQLQARRSLLGWGHRLMEGHPGMSKGANKGVNKGMSMMGMLFGACILFILQMLCFCFL